jgi:hypothetical protein
MHRAIEWNYLLNQRHDAARRFFSNRMLAKSKQVL